MVLDNHTYVRMVIVQKSQRLCLIFQVEPKEGLVTDGFAGI